MSEKKDPLHFYFLFWNLSDINKAEEHYNEHPFPQQIPPLFTFLRFSSSVISSLFNDLKANHRHRDTSPLRYFNTRFQNTSTSFYETLPVSTQSRIHNLLTLSSPRSIRRVFSAQWIHCKKVRWLKEENVRGIIVSSDRDVVRVYETLAWKLIPGMVDMMEHPI